MQTVATAAGHRLNPWSYVRDVLDQLAARSADVDLSDLFPDAWTNRHAARMKIPNVPAAERLLRREYRGEWGKVVEGA